MTEQTELLIVDDEQMAIQGISMLLDWENLGIGRVWTANTIAEARDIIREEQIGIVLCDIEMRSENGLYLAEWIMQNYRQIKCIIVTGHVNFEYTKKSVELNVAAYLAKPVNKKDLERAVKKSLEELGREKKDDRNRMENKKALENHFFRSLMQEERGYSRETIKEEIQRRGIALPADDTFYLVLVRFRIWNPEYDPAEKRRLLYGMIPEISQNRLKNLHLLGAKLGEDMGMVCFPEGQMERRELGEKLEELTDYYQTYFGCQVCVYITWNAHLEEFARRKDLLIRKDAYNLIRNKGVIWLEDAPVRELPFAYPDMKIWALLLEKDEFEKMKEEVKGYIGSSYFLNGVTPQRMRKLIALYKEMWIIWLKELQEDSGAFWSAVSARQSEEEASASAEQCMAWMAACIDTAGALRGSGREGQESMVRKVCAYIEEHLTEDISRKELADMVYLSPDHMARAFKKETGMTLTDYIVEQKMKKSAELLKKTDFSVSFIASYIGYSNLSHFSGAFKNFSGISPTKFREIQKEKENGTA